MENKALEVVEEKHAGGAPVQITSADEDAFLEAIASGSTQDQAADLIGYNRDGIRKHLKKHPELVVRLSRARSSCIQVQVKGLSEIAAVRDVKGLTAAVKAGQFLLAGYDERFRKARDGDSGSGSGTTINVITAIAPQSMSGFFAAGGKAQPKAVRILIDKYGPSILGDITEETAMRIAAESVGENGIGTQSGDRGGARPERARTHTPITPGTISEAIEAATEAPVDSDPSDPIPSPAVNQETSDDQ